MPKEPKISGSRERERDSYVPFFLSWNQVAMKGKENPNEAPPTRTRNSRTLFFVWKGIFCLCVIVYVRLCKKKVVVTLNNAHQSVK